jgi:hypothetical protein
MTENSAVRSMLKLCTVILAAAALYPGAFIGVPATIAILIICEQHAASRWIAVMLSDAASRKYE